MKRILFATTIGLAVLTTGCTGITATPATTPTTDGTTPTSSSDTASGLEVIKPCDLLTEADVNSLGLTYPGKASRVGTSDGCVWNTSGDGGVRAGIRTKNACTIGISVSESSSVLVIANLDLSSEDTAAACTRASQAAGMIAPKLPR